MDDLLDPDRGDTYSPSTVRPQTNPAAEASRTLPQGVRNTLRNINPGEDLHHLPDSILQYMKDNGMVSTPDSSTKKHLLVLSDFGKHVREYNVKRQRGGKES